MTTAELEAVEPTPHKRPRTIDVPLEELPPIDEHEIEVDAPADACWAALFPALEQSFDSRFARKYAIKVGAHETTSTGDLHHPGGTLPGFTVTRAIAPVMLAMAGEHLHAKYAIVLKIDLLPGQRSRVRLETRAQFQGAKGKLYKIGVIGSGGHVILVRRLLRSVKRRAEKSAEGR